MLNYQALNPDPLTKLSFQAQITLAPWCFPLALQTKTQLPIGVFPIITVDAQKKSSILVMAPKEQSKNIERYFPRVQMGSQFPKQHSKYTPLVRNPASNLDQKTLH